MSKALAVECMHRMLKHFGDFLGQEVPEGEKAKTLSDEIFEILDVWGNRETFEGKDLNTSLKLLREIRANNGAIKHGWIRKGRSGFSTG